jgi:hypothetical protein
MTPMLSSEWQAAHDPDSDEQPTEDLRFRYDGKFTANEKIVGKWKTIKVVASAAEFDPKAKNNPERPLIKDIDLRADGSTAAANLLWSGGILMDLDRSQALKMELKNLDGSDYLFIESGGFDPKNPLGWKPLLMVMQRQ